MTGILMFIRTLFLFLLPLLYLVATAGGVWAHARLLETIPPANAVSAEPPTHVVLQFDSRVEKKVGASFSLVDPSGSVRSLAAGNVANEPGDRVSIPLPSLGSGDYRFEWSVISRDGHRVQGSFSFSIE